MWEPSFVLVTTCDFMTGTCQQQFIIPAIIRLIYGTGLRISEALSLKKMAKSGMDIYYSLPLLSVFLGHRSSGATEHYVRLTSEMYPNILNDKNGIIVLPPYVRSLITCNTKIPKRCMSGKKY